MWPPGFLLIPTEKFHDVASHLEERLFSSGICWHVPYSSSNDSLLVEWINALVAKWECIAVKKLVPC